jgi:hypothetical protein
MSSIFVKLRAESDGRTAKYAGLASQFVCGRLIFWNSSKVCYTSKLYSVLVEHTLFAGVVSRTRRPYVVTLTTAHCCTESTVFCAGSTVCCTGSADFCTGGTVCCIGSTACWLLL